MNEFLLIVEKENHPFSVLNKIKERFEETSIIRVYNASVISSYKTKPVLNNSYLFIFESFYIFKQAVQQINLSIALPVLFLRNKLEAEEVVDYLKTKNIKYKVIHNDFTNEHASKTIDMFANSKVSDSCKKELIKQTKNNPTKLLAAITVLNSVGYSVSKVKAYVPYTSYISTTDIIQLIFTPQDISNKKREEILNYIYAYRNAYKTLIRDNLVAELDKMYLIFQDMLSGVCDIKGSINYIADRKGITYREYNFINSMFYKVSIAQIIFLKQYIEKSNMLSFLNLI